MRTFSLGPNRRLHLQWHVTERCNLRCTHCYQGSAPVEELSFEECLSVLGQFEHLLGRLETTARPKGHITLTGGEPFVRADFLKLLRAIAPRRDICRFSVLTNGTLIDEALAGELADLRPAYVQVSIEGGPATHDRIRGRGSFAKTVDAVRHLVEQGVRTTISFTAHRENYTEFPEVVRLGRELRVDRVWSDRLIPCGEGASLSTLSAAETRSYLQIMSKARGGAGGQRRGQTEVAMHRALQFLEGDGRPYRCSAGRSLITLLPNGDLVPCRRMPLRAGNVLRTDLSELYFRSELLRELRDEGRVAAGCEGCLYKRACGGGLRCLAQAVRGDWKVADPGCWLARDRAQDPGSRAVAD